MDMFDMLIETVVIMIRQNESFKDCVVHNAFNSGMRPNPLKKPHIMVSLGPTDISQCSISGKCGYNNVKSRLKGDFKVRIDIAVPFELDGITCAKLFSQICRCIFTNHELTLEPLGISCGEVTADRYSASFVMPAELRFNSLLSF